MSILVNKSTRVVVQGITGKEGSFHATQCKAYGTKVVAGVTPGKAGQEVEGIPVFNTVADAVKKTECDTSLIFVPPPFCADAILEAADAGIKLIICITEGIPVNDMVKVKRALRGRDRRTHASAVRPRCGKPSRATTRRGLPARAAAFPHPGRGAWADRDDRSGSG